MLQLLLYCLQPIRQYYTHIQACFMFLVFEVLFVTTKKYKSNRTSHLSSHCLSVLLYVYKDHHFYFLGFHHHKSMSSKKN